MVETTIAVVLGWCLYGVYTFHRINRATDAMNRNTDRMTEICDELERQMNDGK
jgi:hypothetical protein